MSAAENCSPERTISEAADWLVMNGNRSAATGGNTPNWIGIDVDWDNGAHFGDANVFSNNVITGGGAGQTGIRIVNVQSNPEMQASIGGNQIGLTGAGSVGISLSVTGLSPLQVTNLGGINLTTTQNNLVNAPTPFIHLQNNGATINGKILVNGVLAP